GDEVAMDGTGQVELNHIAREVRAVAEEQIEVADIAAVVEQGDEARILFGRAGDLEAMNGPVIGGPHQLGPLAARSAAVAVVWRQSLQVRAAVTIAERCDLLLI